jgi:phenylalanyl-tRNA synthetase beta chain
MKLSINQLKQNQTDYKWSDDVTTIGVDQLAQKIGAQLGAIDEIVATGDKYKGLVIVKVVSCTKHTDADKLNVCKVDDDQVVQDVERDDQGLVQVVCGAPNVREGMLAVWLPPGSTVPESFAKEPFVLGKRELRGVTSNGMLASEKELDLSDSHNGILAVNEDFSPGSDFAESLGLAADHVLDIENKMFTHRPDCFGIMGLAREIAGIENMQFTSPSWYSVEPQFEASQSNELPVEVKNELPDQVVRFSVLTLKNVEVGPSPLWLKVALSRQGLRSINNLVDLTNYNMLLTGQPLHAYDYDKVKALSGSDNATIVVRKPNEGETIELLNGKTITPRPEAIMIATDQQLIGLGGVMGGSQTEVDNSTKNIILEAANFNMYSIRRTSMHHGLFSDAVTRFTKGQSPLQTKAVLLETAKSVKELCGADIAGPLIDDNRLEPAVMQRGSLHDPVEVSASFINSRLGLSLSSDDIKNCLSNVEFKVDNKTDDILIVSAPFWRIDIELREDIVEEVGRLIGFDKLPLKLPERSISPVTENKLLKTKALIRTKLSQLGANEVLTYSFVDGSLLDKAGQDKNEAFELANALRPELQYYRLSLLPSLANKVYPNLRAGYNQFALFEIGKVHSQDLVDKDEVNEQEQTAFVITTHNKLKRPGSPYYQAKLYLEDLTGGNLDYLPISEADKAHTSIYEPSRACQVKYRPSGETLGFLGEFNPSFKHQLKLPDYSAGFEVDTNILVKILSSPPNYTPLSRFPSISQDISLKVADSVTYHSLLDLAAISVNEANSKDTDFKIKPIDIYQSDEDKTKKSITLRLTLTSYERTLTDKEASLVLDRVAEAASSTLQAERL